MSRRRLFKDSSSQLYVIMTIWKCYVQAKQKHLAALKARAGVLEEVTSQKSQRCNMHGLTHGNIYVRSFSPEGKKMSLIEARESVML